MPSTELWKLPRPNVCRELLRDWALMSFHRVSVGHQSPSAQALQHGGGRRAVADQAHRLTRSNVKQVTPGELNLHGCTDLISPFQEMSSLSAVMHRGQRGSLRNQTDQAIKVGYQ